MTLVMYYLKCIFDLIINTDIFSYKFKGSQRKNNAEKIDTVKFRP